MKIQLQAIEHRGEKRIRLDFKRDEKIITKVKQIKGRKWSQTKRCWHLPYAKAAFEQLKAIFGEELVLPEQKGATSKTEQPLIIEQIRVLPEHNFRVKVLIPWQRKDWIAKIKSLPNRAWNQEGKYWSVPKQMSTLRQLQSDFGEALIVDKTIQWQENEPSKSSILEASETVFQASVPLAVPPTHFLRPKFINFTQAGEQVGAVVGEQIIFNQSSDEWIAAFVPYDKRGWVSVIKNIVGRRWLKKQKCWELPYVKSSFRLLKKHIGLNHCHFNFEIKADIPETFEPVLPKNIKRTIKKTGFELLNTIQKDEVTRLKEQLTLERLSPATLKAYSNHLTSLFVFYKDFHPHDITNKNVQQYLLHQIRFKKIAESTQNQIINAVKAYWERVLKRPKAWIEIPRPKRPKQLPNVLSTEEVVKLVESPKNLKHKLILLLIYSSGLRLGEVTSIRTKDINVNRRVIHIKGAKGKKDRYVVLANSVIPYIDKYIKQYKPSRWFFEGQHGGQYSKRSVQNIFHKALEQSKINAYATVHTLRHSYATHCVEAGYNLKFVQEALGHESLKTTERYLHIASEALRKLKSPLDNLDFR
ncbi:MAG: tyrosine-type recombinase/integrase [Bacteroidota bacterium]